MRKKTKRRGLRGGGGGGGMFSGRLGEACGCVRRGRDDDSSSCRSSQLGQSMHSDGGVRERKLVRCSLGARALAPLLRLWRREDASMTKAERTMKAAILIQQWYRRYLARMEMRRRYTWTIFQSIEYAGEHDQVKLYKFFHALLGQVRESGRGSGRTSRASSLLEQPFSSESDSGGDGEVGGGGGTQEKGGPDLHFPLQRRDVELLIDAFRKKKHGLGARRVARILREAAASLRRLPNINAASTAISNQITVCGDLHGKLDDLLVVFHKNGLPSLENPYVFNGDFVDRGRKGLEVFLLLLACQLAFPGGVYLNRGNHEDLIMNARYGFIKEVHQKYKHNAEKLLKLVEEVYRWLPLATLINNRVMVVHGGISDSTDLNVIHAAQRHKYVSLLRPPLLETAKAGDAGAGDAAEGDAAAGAAAAAKEEASKAELVDKAEWKQVFDILWSDPQTTSGCVANTLRGAGTYFGPDVTRDFLQRHRLSGLIRSHECKPGGYEIIHDGHVVTIFSASNYYELGSNKGAYLKLWGNEGALERQFVQYTSGASRARRLTFRQRVGLVESSALRELHQHIAAVRAPLETAFRELDMDQSGFISISDWCWALEQTTQLGLPWRMLRDKLARLSDDKRRVRYMDTFTLYSQRDVRKNSGGGVVETLYKNKSSLEAIFKILDKDNSGYITLEEFSEACSLLGEHMPNPMTREQLRDIGRLMDINKDGLVDLNEFLESFRLAERRADGDLVEDDDGAT